MRLINYIEDRISNLQTSIDRCKDKKVKEALVSLLKGYKTMTR